jgi:hypothetical protein
VHLRAYPEVDDIDLTGDQPLLTLKLRVEDTGQDGWVTASTITTALIKRLNQPTA